MDSANPARVTCGDPVMIWLTPRWSPPAIGTSITPRRLSGLMDVLGRRPFAWSRRWFVVVSRDLWGRRNPPSGLYPPATNVPPD